MLCNHMDCSTTALPYPSLFPRLLTLTSSEWMMPSNGLILYHPPSPPALCLSSIGVFSNESAVRLGWWKYWSFGPSNEYSWLIFFRMDWFDLLAVQGTLKSFLQHHSLKASIHQHSTFFMVQLSYSYTNWKLRSFCCFRDCTQVLHFRLLLIMRTTPFLLRQSCPQE